MKMAKKLIGTLALMAILMSVASVAAANEQTTNAASDDYSSAAEDCVAAIALKPAIATNMQWTAVPIDGVFGPVDAVRIDPPTADVKPEISERIVLRGNGTVIAVGCGRAMLAGTGIIRVSCRENGTVIVSSNAYVTPDGDWENEVLENGAVKYTGSGTLYISGADIKVHISGRGIKLLASGKGQVILVGRWWYRAFGWRRIPRPIAIRIPKENLRALPVLEKPEAWENWA
jgi:hypothetical protein